jgi:hypothetical protein
MQMNSQEYKVLTETLNVFFMHNIITSKTYSALRDTISTLIIEHELTT